MRFHTCFAFGLAIGLTILLAACGGETDSGDDATDNTASPPATAEPTLEAEDTPDIFAESNPSTSEDGSYFLTVSYVLEAGSFPEITPAPDSGQRWIAVGASIGNESDQPLTVTTESLVLVDDAGTRYTAQPTPPDLRPPLTEASLAPGEVLLGLALFQIPDAAVPQRLEWCPISGVPADPTCAGLLQALVP